MPKHKNCPFENSSGPFNNGVSSSPEKILSHTRSTSSDNGSQFVGAEKELRQMVSDINDEEVKEFCGEQGMQWKFITPGAPHQNGFAEALVKNCKTALKKAVGSQVLTPMEPYTIVLEVANLVNQRPIGGIPNNPDDGINIYSNDAFLRRASSEIPQGPFKGTNNPRHRVEFVQKIIDSFWKRWNRDVFPSLVPRKKWQVEKRNVRPVDTVVVSDPSAFRGKWSIARAWKYTLGLTVELEMLKLRRRLEHTDYN